MHDLNVYVPRPGSPSLMHVLSASGIVGSEAVTADGEDLVRIDFEGDLSGHRPDLRRYADRVYRAGCRHTAPDADDPWSVSRAWVRQSELTKVGVFDGVNGVIVLEPGRECTLAHWLGVSSVSEDELTSTAKGFERRRESRALMGSHDLLKQQIGWKLWLQYGARI